MRHFARKPFGALPASGARIDERRAIACAATLHVEGVEAQAVQIADLTPGGCRVTVTIDLAVATHVSLMLAGATLISGRVAWNDGQSLGIDFCTPLLPKIIARLTTARN